jgi:RNA polymerase sigma-70 factor (ECF subfamily)
LRRNSHEAELVDLARRGDADAFGELYRLNLDAIYHYISKRIGEPRDVEDITQTVFIKAWQALGSYQPSRTPFRGWLYRIAHNKIVDHYRTQKETCSLTDEIIAPDGTNAPQDATISRERSEILRRAIATLRPSYQEVISLRFLCGLDYTETAQVLDRRVGAVRVLQFRALKALDKAMLQANEEGSG